MKISNGFNQLVKKVFSSFFTLSPVFNAVIEELMGMIVHDNV